MPPVAVVFLVRDTHLAFRFQPKRTEIGQKMAKDLKLIACRKTIELQHDRGIERGDVAMPDVARDAREIDCSESAFETAAHRQLGLNTSATARVSRIAHKARRRKRSLFVRYSRCSSLPVRAETSAESQNTKCCATSMRSNPVRVRIPTS